MSWLYTFGLCLSGLLAALGLVLSWEAPCCYQYVKGSISTTNSQHAFLRNTNLQKDQVNYDNSTTSNCHFERIHLLKHLWGEVVHCHFDSPERDFEPTCHWFGSPAQSAVALSRKRSSHRTGWGISNFGILGLQRSLPLCIMETHHPKLSAYHWLMLACCDWHGKYMKIHGFKMPSSLTLFDSSFRSRDTGQKHHKVL